MLTFRTPRTQQPTVVPDEHRLVTLPNSMLLSTGADDLHRTQGRSAGSGRFWKVWSLTNAHSQRKHIGAGEMVPLSVAKGKELPKKAKFILMNDIPDNCKSNQRLQAWEAASVEKTRNVVVGPIGGCMAHLLHRAILHIS